MSTENYTEDELADLSEEERAAISEEIEGEDDELDGDMDEAETDQAEDETEGQESEQADVITVDQTVKTEPPAQDTVRQDNVPLPANIADQFKAERAELSRQFDEGEIELADLLDQRDAILLKEREAVQNYNTEVRAANDWQAAQDKFFADNGHYLKDQSRHAALDACVKAVANMPGVTSFDDCLAKAKRMEEAMNGPVAPAVPENQGKKTGGKSPRPEVPSIVDLPASAANESAGEFAYIDKLTGVQLEDALSKLSEAQQERYLSGK